MAHHDRAFALASIAVEYTVAGASYSETGSGGAVAGGTAEVAMSYTHTASGGCVAGGTADASLAAGITGSGGIVLGGTLRIDHFAPNSFGGILRAAHNALKPLAGASVVYARGDDTETITALLGKTAHEITPFQAGQTRYHSRDFLIVAADFPFDQPRKGDTIAYNGRLFEVLRPDGGEDLWRFSDTTRQVMRIHTKHIGSADGTDAAPQMFADIASAHGSLRNVTSIAITYAREDDSDTLDAIPGSTTFNVLNAQNAIIEVESRDYIFSASDFSFDQPRRGDRITEDNRIYEVLRPDGGSDVWRYSDSAGLLIRVHSHFIGEV